MKKILVPTDFSTHAENALNIALKLAAKFDAEVHIIHVIAPLRAQLLAPDPSQVDEGLEERFLASIHENASHVLDNLLAGANFPKERSITVIEFGKIYERVRRYAQSHQIDIIVMGTNGTRPFDEVFVGSNTERVVRFAPCPVLTVKSDTKDLKPAPRILFPSTLKEDQVKNFKKAYEFAKSAKGSLHLLYVNSAFGFMASEEINQKQQAFLKKAGVSEEGAVSFHQTTASTEEAGILNMAKHLKVDLIALQTTQRKGLAHFFLGSTAEDVVNHSHIPVMAYGINID